MKWTLVIGLALGSSVAQAQSLTFPSLLELSLTEPGILDGQRIDPANTYFDGAALVPGRTYPSTGKPLYGRQFVRLSDIIAASAGTPGPAGPQGIQGPPGPAGGLTSSDLVAIATQFDRLKNRFREGVALAGAINILPPEPGRHINISVGGAGYEGAGAASIAVSARLGTDTIAYVGVARGPTQTLVKGGLGWSPW